MKALDNPRPAHLKNGGQPKASSRRDAKDLKTKREHYLAEAAECELIRDLASDPKKREILGRLAMRKMVADLDAVIAGRAET